MGARFRLLLILALMVASVIIDSTFYIVSAVTDAILLGLAIFFALPLVKQLIKK